MSGEWSMYRATNSSTILRPFFLCQWFSRVVTCGEYRTQGRNRAEIAADFFLCLIGTDFRDRFAIALENHSFTRLFHRLDHWDKRDLASCMFAVIMIS